MSINAILTGVVSKLPSAVRPYAKAFLPFVGTLIAVGVQYATTHTYDQVALSTTLTGLGATVVTLAFPNGSK